jgi:hypothetical protein
MRLICATCEKSRTTISVGQRWEPKSKKFLITLTSNILVSALLNQVNF